jgi:hypothetical protein
MNIVERRNNRGAIFIITPLVIALIAVCIVYDPFHLISDSPETGGVGHPPIWLWVLGVIILGCVMSYGILQNRRRPRAEADITQAATKDLYRREESDRKRNDLP